MDTPSSAHPFSLKLTVPLGSTAVGPGQLHRVSETLDRRKQYEYRLKLDTPPCHVSFAAGHDHLLLACSTVGSELYLQIGQDLEDVFDVPEDSLQFFAA